MSNSIDINESAIKKYVDSMRPESLEMRADLDMGYSYDGKQFILFEIRPIIDRPKEKMYLEFAKIRFYKSRKEWTLYWKRASGKWELYDSFPKSSHISSIIEIIKKDNHGCFYG